MRTRKEINTAALKFLQIWDRAYKPILNFMTGATNPEKLAGGYLRRA
jgi:hypothetical protein